MRRRARNKPPFVDFVYDEAYPEPPPVIKVFTVGRCQGNRKIDSLRQLQKYKTMDSKIPQLQNRDKKTN